ncbi:MAG TPA: zinc chelation protein SecC, partial [Halomonas sp.]|nr:zinc chelation protein SecC [Halomonas sp.]
PWPAAAEWLPELCRHPEWLDAPAVVQELTLALTSRFGSLPWMAPSLFVPLAVRLERWLEQVAAEGPGTLAWEDADNTLLLRTGLALVVGMERGARERSRQLAEGLLALDSHDSLGLCELVLDQLLRDGRDSEALALSEQPLEAEAEGPVLGVLMGRALALYRLDRLEEAAEALGETHAHNVHAVKLMCGDSSAPPTPVGEDGPVEPGSRAEAWQYRTLMRDQWRATPGALAWLQEWLNQR